MFNIQSSFVISFAIYLFVISQNLLCLIIIRNSHNCYNSQKFSVGIRANEFTSSIHILLQYCDISRDVPYFDTILHSLSIIHAFVNCFLGAYEITGVDKSDVHNDFIFAHTAELDGKLVFL